MGFGIFLKTLGLAFKAFFRTFKSPEKARLFIEDKGQPKPAEAGDQSHLRLLYYLQHSGRLVDFIKEDIGPYNDAQIGAAVRKIHQDCAQLLEELVTIRPLREENEGMTIQIPKGYNPAEIKIVGKIKGDPPFTGKLIHRGWKVHKLSLPKRTGDQTTDVICPAEVEIN